MMEKLKQVESTRSYVTFFNYHALKLIRKSKIGFPFHAV